MQPDVGRYMNDDLSTIRKKNILKKNNIFIVSVESAGGGNRAHAYWLIYWNDVDSPTHVNVDGVHGGGNKAYCRSKAVEKAINLRFEEEYSHDKGIS